MKKSLTAVLLITSLLALSACQGGGAPAAESTTMAAATAAASDTASAAASSDMTPAPAAGGFDWKAHEGATLNVMFNEHTYADAVISKMAEFEALTGIKVEYSTTPETNYFDKLNTALSSRSGTPDIFMTGAYQTWEYAPAGYIEPLEGYINDPAKTSPDYNYDDFIPAVIDALKWDLVPGHPVGEGSQWALPMGWEVNILTYNKRILTEQGVEVPRTAEDLLEAAKALKGFNGNTTYGLALRGERSWGTIHPAYMSMFATWGAKDFEVENGKLVSKLDSPEAIAMTEYWVQLVKEGSAPQWSTYGWELAGADLGAGTAAMMWDADRGGYTQNVKGASAEAGNLAFSTIPYPTQAGKTEADMRSNLWVWSMAMNANSKNKDAAWYFLQYFTSADFMLYSGVEGACTDTPRQSVMDSQAYKDSVAEAEGYMEAFETVSANASIFFTPQPYFFETTTMWSETLQDLVVGSKYATVEEAMKELKAKIDNIVSDLEIPQ